MAVLQKIESGDLLASQLFLMGDIFDLLFGHNKYIHTINNVVITLLNKLSRKVEIYYFEGNHDFCLANIFPNIKVYTREEQPIYMSMGNQKIGLSHGDKFDGGFCYDSYCLLLRNKFTLNMLKPFQKHIIDYRIKKLSEKNICHGFINFEAKVGRIMTNYNDVNLVIEGHFHQAKQFGKYISLPSLACQKQIAVVQNNQISYFDMV